MSLINRFKKKTPAQVITSDNIEKLNRIVSHSGISWHELYYVNENKYFACYQIFEYPEESRKNMFREINGLNYAFVSVDAQHIYSGDFISKVDDVKDTSEKNKQDARSYSQYKKAVKNSSDFTHFSNYIEATKESVKTVTARIFIFANTLDELQANSEKVQNILYKNRMTAYIQTNNLIEDYQSHLMFSEPVNQYMSSGNLADITLSSNVNIVDLKSALLGTTATGVYAPNPFSFKNYSYNIALLGGMGSGKSALLKKIMKNLLIRRIYVPLIFDIHGEYDEFSNVMEIDRVSFSEERNINLMEIFFVDNKNNDAIIRENDIQTQVSSVREMFKGFTGIEREQTLLILGSFLTAYYQQHLGKSFTDMTSQSWGTLQDILDAVNLEIKRTNTMKDDEKVKEQYLYDLYNIQTGLTEMCGAYGYLFNRQTNIDFDLTKPLCFDISFLKNNADEKVKSSYVSLLLNYASYGAYLNLERNHEEAKKQGVNIFELDEPFYSHHVVIDEFMQYADDRSFLNETLKLMKYMRKAFSGLVAVVHTTDDTQKSLENSGDLLKSIFSLCTTKYIGRTEKESADNLPALLKGVTKNDAMAVSTFIKGDNDERKFLVVDGQDRKLFFTSIVTPRERVFFKGGV